MRSRQCDVTSGTPNTTADEAIYGRTITIPITATSASDTDTARVSRISIEVEAM
ncbi:MAG: hypothetical protein K8963_01090 [Proteobacteria bacterium]|nr:hypothetical protein [Pseudomonadota bacterium]